MKIRDVMTRTAQLTSPDDTLRHAAQMMKECDVGVLPVADGDRLVGMITDRDIAIRAAAGGRAPGDIKVREAMTPDLVYSFEDQDTHEAEDVMQEKQIRRLPILNRDKRLTGTI